MLSTYFLVGSDCFKAIALLLIDDAEVEERGRVGFFSERHFEVFNCLLIVFSQLIIKNTDIEICFEVFRVYTQCLLIEWKDQLENASSCCCFDTLG